MNYSKIFGYVSAIKSAMLRLDAKTEFLVCIDSEHHEVHEGDAFTYCISDSTMANAETIAVGFKTPAGAKKSHLIVGFDTLVGGYLQILEAPTITTDTGTVVVPVNRDRKSTNESTLLEDKTATPAFTANGMLLMPTITDVGTVICRIDAFGAANKKANGARGHNEFILKADTVYAIRFTAVGAANKGQLILDWYEHTDSN